MFSSKEKKDKEMREDVFPMYFESEHTGKIVDLFHKVQKIALNKGYNF